MDNYSHQYFGKNLEELVFIAKGEKVKIPLNELKYNKLMTRDE